MLILKNDDPFFFATIPIAIRTVKNLVEVLGINDLQENYLSILEQLQYKSTELYTLRYKNALNIDTPKKPITGIHIY